MQFSQLDHVNVRTANLDAMVAWYADVLDMPAGARPNFGFPGAWLYCAGNPIVHLIGVDEAPQVTDMQLEHFAIRAEGLPEFIGRLKDKGVDHQIGKVLDFGIIQVNVWDPDGNHIHIDFSAKEAEGMDI